MCAAAEVPVKDLALRSDSLRKIAIIAFDGQHAVRQIRNLVLALTLRFWACWGQ